MKNQCANIMPQISKTRIQNIQNLLHQCSQYIENSSPPTSPLQDLARRCNQMIKKLKKEINNDLSNRHTLHG